MLVYPCGGYKKLYRVDLSKSVEYKVQNYATTSMCFDVVEFVLKLVHTTYTREKGFL